MKAEPEGCRTRANYEVSNKLCRLTRTGVFHPATWIIAYLQLRTKHLPTWRTSSNPHLALILPPLNHLIDNGTLDGFSSIAGSGLDGRTRFNSSTGNGKVPRNGGTLF